jgi:hypothetical protein
MVRPSGKSSLFAIGTTNSRSESLPRPDQIANIKREWAASPGKSLGEFKRQQESRPPQDVVVSQTLAAPPTAASMAVVLQQIKELTEEIFGELLMIESLHDPEDPEFPWLVFYVPFAGSVDESLEPRNAWHAGVNKLVPDSAGEFRLWLQSPNDR